jgi:hypothetical protein
MPTTPHPTIPRLLASFAAILLALATAGCGGAGGSHRVRDPDDEETTTVTTPSTDPAPVEATVDADHDNDVGAAEDDRNNNSAVDFGHEARPAERRAIVALVKRYYAAALADDGTRDCSLLLSTIAEAAPNDNSREPGTPAYMHGQTTCAGVLDKLFHHYHAQLAAEAPKLRVGHVRLEEHHGLVFLRFGALPERESSVIREGRVWKMSQIYDQAVP